MIMSLKVNYKCQSRWVCIHVGFYVMWYVWSCELRWWASPPQLDLLDLSHCTRVYVRGRRWVRSWSEIYLVWSDTYLQIPTKRSLGLSWLRCRLNLHRNAGTVCGASTMYLDLTSAFKEVKDPDGFCMSPLYTSDRHFSEPRHLAIILSHGLWQCLWYLQWLVKRTFSTSGGYTGVWTVVYGKANSLGRLFDRLLLLYVGVSSY
jgi:hypothetical protein